MPLFAPHYRQFWAPPQRLAERLRAEFDGFDVVYGQSVAPNGLSMGLFLAACFKAPYVDRLHTYPPDYYPYCYPAGAPGWMKWLIRVSLIFLLRQSCASMQRVVLSNRNPTFLRFLRTRLGVRPARTLINHIPVGIDVRRRRGQARSGDPAHQYVFLTVARLSPEKNHRFLIDLWNRDLHRRYPNARWRIVGDGPIRAELEGLVTARDRVDILGAIPREQVFSELGQADLMLYASRSEAFGMVILEAKACGLPVVALTDQAGVDAQLDTGDLRSGLVDEDSYAETIRGILADPGLYARMSEAGCRDVEDNYSQAQVTRLLEDLESVAAAGTPPWHTRAAALVKSWVIRRLLWSVPRHLMNFYQRIPRAQR